jgi:hypothetical protein
VFEILKWRKYNQRKHVRFHHPTPTAFQPCPPIGGKWPRQ